MTAGTSALLVLIGGGAAGIAALTKDRARVVTATGRESATGATHSAAPALPDAAVPPAVAGKGLGAAKVPVAVTDRRTSDEADRTATREPRTTDPAAPRPPAAPAAAAGGASAAPKPPTQPAMTTRTVTETRAIPFRTWLVRDPSLPRGTRRVQTEGVPGIETLRYLVTYAGGRETGRQLLDSAVTRQPQHRVIAFGARGGPGHDRRHECGPGLSGCLPIGRSACPKEGQVEESGAVQLGGSVDLLDHDMTLLDPDDLDGLELDPGMVC
jgi:surface rod structure-forming protein G